VSEIPQKCPIKDFCNSLYQKVDNFNSQGFQMRKLLSIEELPNTISNEEIAANEDVTNCMSNNMSACAIYSIYQPTFLRSISLEEYSDPN